MTNKTLIKIEELITEFKDLLNSDSNFNYDDSKTEFLRWIEETQGTDDLSHLYGKWIVVVDYHY